MSIEELDKKTLEFNPDKTSKLVEDLVTLFQEVKPTIGEILIAYGNLGYILGASIEGHKGQGPNIEELKKLYLSNPTVGVNLMLTGINITTWYEDHQAQTLKKIT